MRTSLTAKLASLAALSVVTALVTSSLCERLKKANAATNLAISPIAEITRETTNAGLPQARRQAVPFELDRHLEASYRTGNIQIDTDGSKVTFDATMFASSKNPGSRCVWYYRIYDAEENDLVYLSHLYLDQFFLPSRTSDNMFSLAESFDSKLSPGSYKIEIGLCVVSQPQLLDVLSTQEGAMGRREVYFQEDLVIEN